MPYTVADPRLALALALDDASWIGPPEITNLATLARNLASVPDPEIDSRYVARLEVRLMNEPAGDAGVHDTAIEEALPAKVTALYAVPTASSAALPQSASKSSFSPIRLPKPFSPVPPPAREHAPAPVIALPRRRFVLRKTIAAAIAAAMLVALPVAASASALPGTPFYGLKRLIERVQMHFTAGPVRRGFLNVYQGARRLNEADQLVALGNTRLVPPTLTTMEAALRGGTSLILANAHDPATLRKLETALRRATGQLSALFTTAPPAVKTDILAALVSGRALTQQVADALGLAKASIAGHAPAQPVRLGIAAPFAGFLAIPVPPSQVSPPSDPTSPASGPKQGPRDDTSSDHVDGGCAQDAYAGPGNGAVHATCAQVNGGAGIQLPPLK